MSGVKGEANDVTSLVKKNRGNKTPNAKTNTKRKGQSRKKLDRAKHKRSRMEIVAYALGIAAFVTGAIAALFGVIHYRDSAIWTTCIAILLGVIGGFCWLQDREWKKDARAPEGTPKERAMVLPVSFGGDPKVGEPFQASVRYKNTSTVLAKSVRIVFRAYGIPKDKEPDFDLVEKQSPDGPASVLAPNEALTSFNPENPTKPLTAIDVAEMENGNVVVYAFGKIYYRDTPTCKHWTTFCVRYIPSLKRYSDYGPYNDTDEVRCP